MADLQSLHALREKAFGADLEALHRWHRRNRIAGTHRLDDDQVDWVEVAIGMTNVPFLGKPSWARAERASMPTATAAQAIRVRAEAARTGGIRRIDDSPSRFCGESITQPGKPWRAGDSVFIKL